MSACVDKPLSWLLLERYDLGELPRAEAERVAAHLSVCEACRACHEKIETEARTELPPLPRARPRSKLRRLFTYGGPIALAALAILGVRVAQNGAPTAPSEHVGVKGGDVTMALVRDGEGLEAGIYKPGDRFKVLVTCPPSLDATWELVVLDDNGLSLPLAPSTRVACGNEVALPGAFRLTGSGGADVCVVWHDGGNFDRRALTTGGRTAVERGPHVCQHLEPAP